MKRSSGNRFGKFLLLWTGELISAVGSGLTSFGLGVYVFRQTGKASATALVTLLAFLPALLLSAPAGVLADRYDRRNMMMLGDGLSALGLVFILGCLLRGELRLWQICVGVTVSSVFSSLMEPAYKATVTDLLTPEQYTKASGLVSVAGSAKYLISPVLAGFLLTFSDIRLLLWIDICTFFITVSATFAVRGCIAGSRKHREASFLRELRDGWDAIARNKGVLLLVILTSAVTFFLGFIQILSGPMILAFSDSATLGVTETVCALGMLVSSLLIGTAAMKKGYAGILSGSLFMAGLCMVLFGLREELLLIMVSGFLFFGMLPFANTSLDFLIRTNIENGVQGRAWGMIGVISQLGYVAAYAFAGLLADGLGNLLGVGVGRGSGYLIMAAGVLLSVSALVLYRIKAVRQLERRGTL